MSLITWTDKLSVSVPEMDEQHKKLIKMINDLNDALNSGKGSDAISSVLDEMVLYAYSHFENEERMLASVGYSDLDAHKKIHLAFMEKAISLKMNFQSGNVVLCHDVMEYLSRWLIEHIMGTDKKYSSVMASYQKESDLRNLSKT